MSKNKYTIKAYLLCASILALLSPTECQSQFIFPNPSPKQIIRQDFGLSSIEITYSRPGVKGRRMIGNTEPYDSVWRTGANAPTLITFGSEVSILNKRISAGTYALYTMPSEKEWVVILNKGIKNWGSDGYQKRDDVCRVSVKTMPASIKTETMGFQFENVKSEHCDLVLSWENWSLSIPIEVDIRSVLRKQVEENLAGNDHDYWSAAQFYFEYDSNPKAALDMINAAIKQGERLKPYWYYHYKARILRSLQRNDEAVEAATLSFTLAKAHGNRNNYLRLNEELIAEIKGR
jgi:hypothetical protein